MTAAAPRRDRDWARALVVVSAAAVVRLAFAAVIPVFPDEAYYWEWSRRLAPGYFDHPPMVALLIRLGTTFVGTNPLGIRIGGILAGWIASLATISIARRLAGDSAAMRAAVVMSVLPLAAAGLVLATPDAPLLAAEALTLSLVVLAVDSPGPSVHWSAWPLAGLALGLAFVSKYTSILIPLGVVIAIASRRSLRAWLARPGPYVACVIAALVFMPVLAWNARHDWVSFAFQLRHGLAAPKGSLLVAAWKHEGDLLGGQAGLASPIVFVLMAIAAGRALRRSASDAERVLGVVAVVSFAFFVYSAVRQRVEPNWPAPAYVPAIVLLAVAVPAWRAGVAWYRAGAAMAAAMSCVIYAQAVAPVLPLAPSRDPIARAFGWSDLARAADSTASAVSTGSGAKVWLGADRYQEAAELALLSPDHPTTFATNLSGRPNQYDLWKRFPDAAHPGDDFVFVVDESPEPHAAVARLAPYFASVEKGALVALRRGRGQIGLRRIWVLLGWRGGWPAAN